MESSDENLVTDLIENQNCSYEQTSVLKERHHGVRGFSSRSARRFYDKRSISSSWKMPTWKSD